MTSELTRSVSVYHRRDGALEVYDRETTNLILDAAARGAASVRSTKLPGRPVFDLHTMKQRKSCSIEEEDIVIEVSWSPDSFKDAQAVSGNASFCNMILRSAILWISEEKSLSKILDLKGVPPRRIRPNPYLRRGCWPLDSFISSLETAKEIYDAALQLASDPTFSAVHWLESNDLYVVFHGTNHSVMDNILLTGLLPRFRKSASDGKDWFGVDFTTSLKYSRCKTKFLSGHRREYKLLLFMVLRPDAHSAGVMTSSDVHKQLPLAELTLL
ncbi:hypothetical protein AXG93_2090s1240 [Marchantia polymorpha subsp. ruderalis]|uniref:Uncharacterized protein n=1 Tax=Marchantia polymorpha subsp. ruderalis TaxID=1480154 RepID=A0A176W8L7_MARPO|nr:hypothetical protein AXG93_2090s1240 [Marchantia polymorpha subsp. ruderalis]